MGTKYLIWKDKDCQGVNPEWLFLSGKEFFDFIKSEQSKGRYFIKQPALDDDDDTIIIEGTKEQYLKAEIERKHHKYLMEQSAKYETVSAYSYTDEDGCNIYDKVPSKDILPEDCVISTLMLNRLKEIIEFLTPEEVEIVKMYFFTDEATERSIANNSGILQQTLHKRKKNVLIKMKKFFCQN